MKKKITFLTLCALLFALCLSAEAQQPKKVPRIGFLARRACFGYSGLASKAFREGLRELGCIEGKNIIIEYRSAEGKLERRSEHCRRACAS